MENVANEPQSPDPQPRSSNFKLVIVGVSTALITALIVGVSVFAWQERQNNVIKSDFEQRLSVLQKKIDGAQTSPIPTPKPSIAQSADRILLTRQNRSQYSHPQGGQPMCNTEFNNDAFTTTAKYTNTEKGISFDVPFNPAWGNEQFRLNPYDEGSDVTGLYSVEYGPIMPFEGCAWVRDHFVNFQAPKSSAAYIAELQNADDYPSSYSTKPSIMHVNGLEVVKYEVGGLCTYPTLVVIGKKYNYQFVPTCGETGDFQPLENIIKTVKLAS